MPDSAKQSLSPIFSTKPFAKTSALGMSKSSYLIDELPQFITIIFMKLNVSWKLDGDGEWLKLKLTLISVMDAEHA